MINVMLYIKNITKLLKLGKLDEHLVVLPTCMDYTQRAYFM